MLSDGEITRASGGERAGKQSQAAPARLMQAATYAAVGVALTLIGIKLAAWLVTDSVSMLSSLVDSVMDVLASFINLLAVRHALTPADREHRFGHTKIEPLASLGQAAFIAGSGLFIVIEAVQRLIRPEPVEDSAVGIGVMVVSMALTLALVLFQRFESVIGTTRIAPRSLARFLCSCAATSNSLPAPST